LWRSPAFRCARPSTRATSEFYRDALAAPAAHAAIVLAFDGDEIDQAVKAHPEGLTAYRRFSPRPASPRDALRLRYSRATPPQQSSPRGDSIGQGNP
jgi:hypothetical protein